MKRAWIIDVDHDADTDEPAGTHANAVSLTGPGDADPEYLAVLKSGKGRKFRMYDGDGNLVYEGRAVGSHWAENEGQWLDEWAFGPLWDFGEGNYGCTAIFYRQNGNNTGPWQQL